MRPYIYTAFQHFIFLPLNGNLLLESGVILKEQHWLHIADLNQSTVNIHSYFSPITSNPISAAGLHLRVLALEVMRKALEHDVS